LAQAILVRSSNKSSRRHSGVWSRPPAPCGRAREMSRNSHDTLSRYLNDLRSKSEAVRLKAAKSLRIYVEAEAREMSGGAYSRFMAETTNRIYDLVTSVETHEKIGGIMAIDELIEVQCEDNETKIIRFVNYLRIIFQQPSLETSTLTQASRALGHLARTGGPVTADFVDFELSRSIDWLQGEPRGDTTRRYAAVLVLKELAINAPVYFSPLIEAFLEHIWVAIHSDGKPMVREAAVEALRAVLVIMAKRSDEARYHQLLSKISEKMSEGFCIAEASSIHGSLLVIGELLRNTGNFMHSSFEDTCKIVFGYKQHRHRLVQRATIQLFSQLAHFHPNHFVQHWLDACLTHLITVLKAGGDHYDVAFAAVGEVALAVRDAITSFTPQIVELVNSALASQSKWKKHVVDTNEALRCVSKLAKAVGPSLAPQIESLVDRMFAAGLSQTLLDALSELARSTPSLLPAVQTRLLSCISAVLATPQDTSSVLSSAESLAGGVQSPVSDESAVVLALGALSAFGADDPRARDVVCNSVVWYFDHESPFIRREAALTITRLLLPSPEQIATVDRNCSLAPLRSSFLGSTSVNSQRFAQSYGFSQRIVVCQGHQLLAVAKLLRRVMGFCISDPDPLTRQTVLESLDSRFDPFLCEPTCTTLIAQALHDEEFLVRKAVIQIMGRLAHHNPAYIVPTLRKVLIQILTELEYSVELRQKEEAAEMLSALSLHAHHLLEPYVGAVAKCLLKRLKEANTEGSPKLVANLLEAIGQLSEVCGREMKPFLSELMPLLVTAIQDQGGGTSLKRERAYRALRMVVENTGYVIEPYEKYPSLLPFLIDILRSDVHTGDWQQRQQIIRCIGTLGALDPMRFQRLASSSTKSDPVGGGDGPVVALLEAETQQHAWPWLANGYHHGRSGVDGVGVRTDLFAAHAVAALLKMLNDPSLISQHAQVIQVLMKVFKSLEGGCLPFLSEIMATFMQVVKSPESPERQVLLGHLAELVRIAGPRIGDYLQSIFEVIDSIWRETGARAVDSDSVRVTLSLLTLLEEISRCHCDSLKAYLGDLLPTILGFLQQNRGEPQRQVVMKVLDSLVVFGPALGNFLHLVIPALVRRCVEEGDGEVEDQAVRQKAIRALGKLSTVLYFPHLLSRVVHPLLRILDTAGAGSTTELLQASVDTLTQFNDAFGEELAIFMPQIRRVLVKRRLTTLGATLLEPQPQLSHASSVQSSNPVLHRSPSLNACQSFVSDSQEAVNDSPFGREMQPNQQSLRQAWEASHRSTKDDWVEWMRRFALELLRESASPALRACWALAQVYYPLSRELFHAAFLSCWVHLYDPYQDVLVRSLETALHSPNLPTDILQALLNLAEFMDRSGLPLPIDARTLGGLSEKCHAYAKALHYKEMEFASSPAACVEALISINTQLQQSEAAQGILAYARKNLNVELREPWYERLQRWEDALEAYEKRQLEDPENLEWTKSRMRCLHELGEWPRLSQLARSVWDAEGGAPEAAKQEIAALAAAAEFHLRDWDRMGVVVDALEGSRNSSYEGCLYSAILAIHRVSYRQASGWINKAREMLDPELTALVGESYTRAYRSLMKVQQLTELEEIVKYKMTDSDQIREDIREMWTNRLNGCQSGVDVWLAAVQTRSIVVPQTENLGTWLKFSSLCRRSSRLDLAMKTLDHLRGDPTAARDPRFIVAYLKNKYAQGCKRQACQMMRSFLETAGTSGVPATLLARCHLKMGLWTREAYEDENKTSCFKNPQVQREVLSWFQSSIQLNGEYYKAWNAWALANFQVVEAIEAAALQRAADDASLVGGSLRQNTQWSVHGGALIGECKTHVLEAVRGFVKSVVLARKTALQDILRLLTLWFKYAGEPEVEPALREGFDTTPLNAWLQVIPQILARLRSPNEHLRRDIRELLSRVARAYPQSVVFPLTVATKSTVDTLASSTRSLLQGMREDGAEQLVRQSEMVSDELIRISILWHEMWCDALEEASRHYYAESDPEAMIAVLWPLHEQMKSNGPQTMREIAFQQAFSRELQEAKRCIERFQQSGCKADTDQAWQSYYKVFQKIKKQVQGLSHLDMESVSPHLLSARNLELAVPGTYTPERSGTIVTIKCFSPSIEVISTSKQRPRILQVMGSDGQSYQFLLKGHEDLKQDERVMQLFGLINSLLEENAESAKRNLSIMRFSVVPLSTNSGLIEWVPRCDTLHQLIKMYREARHVQLAVEYQLMKSICARCEDLSILQKVEVFRHALNSTSGIDLQRVLWLQSRNSEVWLSRRTTYCRSLAVMSVVGYILGLGDRHPSNMMIARESGQVVHIDFGDCFEIAAFRDKYPEKIPFRLTRMLLKALEVSGVEGNYRYTCELVMFLLRSNKDAVMAMLEAFVFDPLITWRLLQANHRPAHTAGMPMQGQPHPALAYISPLQGHFPVQPTASARLAPSPTPPPPQPSVPPATSAEASEATAPLVVDDRLLPPPFHQHFVCDEPAKAERDLHVASGPGKQARQRELRQHLGPEGVHADPELLSSKGRSVISRVYAKLNGTDFRREPLDVEAQVERLLQEATSHENLCQCYVGWCPFW